jgi:hypothetical protein
MPLDPQTAPKIYLYKHSIVYKRCLTKVLGHQVGDLCVPLLRLSLLQLELIQQVLANNKLAEGESEASTRDESGDTNRKSKGQTARTEQV